MDDITIRRMTLSDVRSVHRIEAATFPRPWTERDFEREMTSNPCARYLVAESGGEIIAFAGIWVILDESHITNIAVAEPWRGKGVGRRITGELLQYAANLGARYATLEVRKSNLRAQRLYASFGFEKAGVRARYYEDNGEDGLIMVLQDMPEAQEDFEEPETVRE